MRPFLISLVALLSALALGTAILGRDRPRLDGGGRDLTDAVVLTSAGTVEMRISDPEREVHCRVPGTDFSGAAPAAGEVVPVVVTGTGTCELAEVTGVLPRGSLTLTGLAGLLGLGVYAVVPLTRRRRTRARDQALATYLSRNVAR